MPDPDPSYMLTVLLADGTSLPVAVTRKRVKNLNLHIRADGSVAVSTPLQTSPDITQLFVDNHADWILNNKKRVRAQAIERDGGCPVPLSGPDAGTIPLWGARADAAQALQLPEGSLRPAAEGGLPAEQIQARIDGFYRTEVKRALPPVAARYEERLGVHAERWQVRTYKSQWGICTPGTGLIRINGALAAYPPVCLDAVVAHELVHLVEIGHNARFHALLDACCPENRTAHELLKARPR